MSVPAVSPTWSVEYRRLAEKWKFVYLFHKTTGSYDYYIIDQLEKAKATNAPINATYQRDDGEWATLKTVRNPGLLRRMGLHELADKLEKTLAEEKINDKAKELVDFLVWAIPVHERTNTLEGYRIMARRYLAQQ